MNDGHSNRKDMTSELSIGQLMAIQLTIFEVTPHLKNRSIVKQLSRGMYQLSSLLYHT